MTSQPGGGWTAAAVRLFAGFAGFGAGAVNLAVSSSLIAGPAGSGPPWQTAVGILSGAWGAALILWTVVSLHRGRTAGPAWSPALLLVGAGGHGAAIALSHGPSSSLNLSHLAALLLTLMIIASRAWLNRQRVHGNDDGGPPATAARPGRLLLAAFAGAVLVAGIATPGLAASTAGQYAVPHGQHGNAGLPNGHHQR
jgi:hypothetical protein